MISVKMKKQTTLKKIGYGERFNIGKKWKCNKDRGSSKGDMIFCASNDGKLLSVFEDGTIRFSRDDCDVKADGKSLNKFKPFKGNCGYEFS